MQILALNDKHGVVVAYIDYAKAFDTVCHAKLLCKLTSYGINSDLLEWIRVFLHDRSHCTRVNNHAYSEYVNIHSGVIQGSVLGPLLFLICLLYTSPSPRDRQKSRMPSSA